MTIATMPVLASTESKRRELTALGCPPSVPWSVIAPHEKQAKRNHNQTLVLLGERGGLSVSEMVAVLEDREWQAMPDGDAVRRLLELVSER